MENDGQDREIWRRRAERVLTIVGGLFLAILFIYFFIFIPMSWIPWRVPYCWMFTCCESGINQTRLEELQQELPRKVYGQHLAVKLFYQSIMAHYRNDRQHSLVLSFHGPPGTGKNFISKLFNEKLFEDGEGSHQYNFISSKNWFKDKSKSKEYEEMINQWVRGNLTKCSKQLFVFDEVDIMPDGLLDILHPIVNYHDHLGKQAVFIFLSNTGGDMIKKVTYKHRQEGGKREDLTRKDFERSLSLIATTEDGGLKDCSLIKSNLIDAFIPFMPLEESHVRSCIIEELATRKDYKLPQYQQKETVDKIIEELYFDTAGEIRFSTKGCKGLATQVDIFLEPAPNVGGRDEL